MKNFSVMVLVLLSLSISGTTQGDLVIMGVIDGDLAGGRPKAIVLQATSDISDLTSFGVGSANNGGANTSFREGGASTSAYQRIFDATKKLEPLIDVAAGY